MESFLKNNTGRIILSIILGLGLSALFKKICYDEEECQVIKYKLPKSIDTNNKEVISKTQDDNCYKYTFYKS